MRCVSFWFQNPEVQSLESENSRPLFPDSETSESSSGGSLRKSASVPQQLQQQHYLKPSSIPSAATLQLLNNIVPVATTTTTTTQQFFTMSKQVKVAQDLCNFINKSPSPYHAVKTAKDMFKAHGFSEIVETSASWNLKPNSKVLLERNGTLYAVCVGGQYKVGNGFTLFGAHTDSPCLRLKPNSERHGAGITQTAVETYGGGIWYSWFDRELTLAGRVMVRGPNGALKLQPRLVDLQKPIAMIPSLAIHLNREVNKGFEPNPEKELVPLLCFDDDSCPGGNHHPGKLIKLLAQELQCPEADILDLELCFAPCEKAQIGGLQSEFVFAPRLDNLFNTFAGVEALIQSQSSLPQDPHVRMAIFFDHEEIGSLSAHGAASNLTGSIMKRIINSLRASSGQVSAEVDDTLYDLTISRSFLVSADQAHGVHPNYADKHEPAHKVSLSGGVVLKFNQNQRYATNSFTASVMRLLAQQAQVPLQEFVIRQDMSCGSTIGPILASRLGVATVDTGSPQLAMHSARETCSVASVEQAVNLYAQYFNSLPALLKETWGADTQTMDLS